MNSQQTIFSNPTIGSLESHHNGFARFFLVWMRARRTNLAFVIGATIGLIGGAVFHSINYIVLYGIPLAFPPFGVLGNILLFAVFGALIGYITGLPARAYKGVLIGALAFFICSEIWIFLSQYLPYASLIDIPRYLTFTGADGLYITLYVIPFAIPLRVLIDRAFATIHRSNLPGLKIKHLFIPLITCALIGYLGLLPRYEREYLVRMDELVKEARVASSASLYPHPLEHEWVAQSFKNHSTNSYQLRIEGVFLWGSYLLDYQDPIMQEIVARFDNGWQLTCGFDISGSIPYCIGSDRFSWSQSSNL